MKGDRVIGNNLFAGVLTLGGTISLTNSALMNLYNRSVALVER